MRKMIIITIDGPAGAGKSTIAKALARRLGISYLDTGAMYRALTFKALRHQINLEDEAALVDLAHQTTIDLQQDQEARLKVLLDGEDVSEEIRSLEVTNNTFYIARAPGVREIMVAWQREIGEHHAIVAEGRDVGTVVFPKATCKFYLDADFEERSRRRIQELKDKGKMVDETQLKEELQTRDHKDFTRQVGPLKKAEDAVVIDSTGLSIEDVAGKMMEYIQARKS
ncbi:MAG: (d)CMP kinase [Candidatus Omnitrophica bacterium]|nr:(d)CMP kinase [Candidatus Omnitrophota bacterium]